MKTPWNLIFPDPHTQEKLQESLRATQRPFLISVAVMGISAFSAIQINYLWKQPWLEPDKIQYDYEMSTIFTFAAFYSCLGLVIPRYSSIFALGMFVSMGICFAVSTFLRECALSKQPNET
jgi:hypothetical protein